MKVLIVTGIYPPAIGGPATYSKLLYEELPTYGIDASVLSFDVVRHMPKIIRHIYFFLKIFFACRGADYIYAQDPVSVGLPALMASRVRGKKFFLKIVGDYAWEQGTQRFGVSDSLDEFSAKTTGYPFFVRFLKRIQIYVAKRAHRIIVPSEYLKKIVSNWGIQPGKIRVIYNAFEKSSETEEKQLLRQKLGFTGTILVSVGRLVAWKGFAVLIEIMGTLRDRFEDITLYIIGEGPEDANLRAVIKNLNLEDTVILTGKMDKKLLHSYIKAADIFVLNTFYEGFSHQLLEVLDAGTPIITTHIGGNPEVITHGKDGLLVPYNNKDELCRAIEKLIEDKVYADTLTKNGRKKVEQFTRKRMLDSLTEEFI